MRIGKWVPLYDQMLPIPRRMAMAFGLHEGSELYLVPLGNATTERQYGCEIMVSPIPFASWRSVCRLSVRLHDETRALALASRFLRENGINILLSECCSTYQRRAHWDAICDLMHTSGFEQLARTPRNDFEGEMKSFLEKLTARFETFTRVSENRDTFLHGVAPAAEFTPMTGLNDAYFVAWREHLHRLSHQGGAVELPEKLARHVSKASNLVPPILPQYAMITGNTEQRYMRVYFLRDHRHMFRMIVDDNLKDFAAGGVGVLNQLIESMPPRVSLIRTANYIMARRDTINRGRIDLMGHWDADTDDAEKTMEQELRRVVSNLVLEDAEGKKHPKALRVVKFHTAKTMHPRVFISYSTGKEQEKLALLKSALAHNNYIPVTGTEMGSQEEKIGERRVAEDVLHSAFSNIESCVAFISLQVKREDFKVSSARAGEQHRYILPPWTIAEEVFAWTSSRQPLIIRLRDEEVEEPRYNRHALAKTFRANDPESYRRALSEVMNELNRFRNKERFARVDADTRKTQFRELYGPNEE